MVLLSAIAFAISVATSPVAKDDAVKKTTAIIKDGQSALLQSFKVADVNSKLLVSSNLIEKTPKSYARRVSFHRQPDIAVERVRSVDISSDAWHSASADLKLEVTAQEAELIRLLEEYERAKAS